MCAYGRGTAVGEYEGGIVAGKVGAGGGAVWLVR